MTDRLTASSHPRDERPAVPARTVVYPVGADGTLFAATMSADTWAIEPVGSPWWHYKGPWKTAVEDLWLKAGLTHQGTRELEAADRDALENMREYLKKERTTYLALWGTNTDAWRLVAPPEAGLASQDVPALGRTGLTWAYFGLFAGRYGERFKVGDFVVRTRGAIDASVEFPRLTLPRVKGVVVEREPTTFRTILVALAERSEPEPRIRFTRGYVLAHLAALPALHRRKFVAGDVGLSNTACANWVEDLIDSTALPLGRIFDFSHSKTPSEETKPGDWEGRGYTQPPRANPQLPQQRGPHWDYYAVAVTAHELLHGGRLPWVDAEGRRLYVRRDDLEPPSGRAVLIELDEIPSRNPGYKLEPLELPDADDLNELIAKLLQAAQSISVALVSLAGDIGAEYWITRITEAHLRWARGKDADPPTPPPRGWRSSETGKPEGKSPTRESPRAAGFDLKEGRFVRDIKRRNASQRNAARRRATVVSALAVAVLIAAGVVIGYIHLGLG